MRLHYNFCVLFVLIFYNFKFFYQLTNEIVHLFDFCFLLLILLAFGKSLRNHAKLHLKGNSLIVKSDLKDNVEFMETDKKLEIKLFKLL